MIRKALRSLIGYLGIKTPCLIRLILILVFPIPRFFIAIAQWGGLQQAAMRRIWNIHRGPLKGYRLVNLLPLEIAPVLANSMEIHCSNMLSRLNLKSAVVFDVGGGYGYYALLLARLVEMGKVYSFEPDWRSYGRLTNNLAINNILNVIPVPVCVSNFQLVLRPWCSQKDDPWNSCLAGNDHNDTNNLTIVPVTSLDNFSRMIDVQNRVRFIKIDVEGSELDVLEGSTNLINCSYPLILCELHSAEIAQQVFNFFSSKNYEWEMVEYMSETRQHIIAFPARQAAEYRKMIAQ